MNKLSALNIKRIYSLPLGVVSFKNSSESGLWANVLKPHNKTNIKKIVTILMKIFFSKLAKKRKYLIISINFGLEED
ncbi:MAG TPA: hypothetical protein DEH02_21805 [Bacteroidales bacterium]|nr:hypothetical protein [Bacteroidales bacterium]